MILKIIFAGLFLGSFSRPIPPLQTHELHRESAEFVDRNLENELIKKLMDVALTETIIDENRKSQIESENEKSGHLKVRKSI